MKRSLTQTHIYVVVHLAKAVCNIFQVDALGVESHCKHWQTLSPAPVSTIGFFDQIGQNLVKVFFAVLNSPPLTNLRHCYGRSDKALQDIVYKVVPGLYRKEMTSRVKFYDSHPEAEPTNSEDAGQVADRLFFSPEDDISMSIEYFDNTRCVAYYYATYIAGTSISLYASLSRLSCGTCWSVLKRAAAAVPPPPPPVHCLPRVVEPADLGGVILGRFKEKRVPSPGWPAQGGSSSSSCRLLKIYELASCFQQQAR